jgi:hypothetical protein
MVKDSMSLKTDLSKLRDNFYSETTRLQFFRDDCAGVSDKALDEVQPLLTKLSALKAELKRKRGHSVMFSLLTERKSLISPSNYRFFTKITLKRVDDIRNYPKFINEMLIVHLAAVFEAYLADFIKTVLTHNQTLLKSSRGVSYDETFCFGDIEALRKRLIEDEITRLSYKSFRDQCKFISDTFGISFTSYQDALAKISEMIDTRHLLVHNRGIVNELYKRNVPNSHFEVGDQRVIDDEYVSDAFETVRIFETRLSDSVIKKFCTRPLRTRRN